MIFNHISGIIEITAQAPHLVIRLEGNVCKPVASCALSLSHGFQRQRNSLAAAYAERDDTFLDAVALHRVQETSG